jgi:hypothetical protein
MGGGGVGERADEVLDLTEQAESRRPLLRAQAVEHGVLVVLEHALHPLGEGPLDVLDRLVAYLQQRLVVDEDRRLLDQLRLGSVRINLRLGFGLGFGPQLGEQCVDR